MKSFLVIWMFVLIQQVICSGWGYVEDLDELEKLANSTNGRIIGGTVAPMSKFKEYVLLKGFVSGSSFGCGGTLISSTWVLTAAHCVIEGDALANILAYIGVRASSKPEQRIPSLRVIAHENYKKANDGFDYDIGLVQLAKAVQESKTISYAVLAPKTDPPPQYVDSKMEACGFGLINDKNETPKSLKWTTLLGVDQSVCQLTNFEIVCTKWSNSKISNVCSGDSGGPLLKDKIQVGIASFILGTTCMNKHASGFVNVAMYRDWITANAQ